MATRSHASPYPVKLEVFQIDPLPHQRTDAECAHHGRFSGGSWSSRCWATARKMLGNLLSWRTDGPQSTSVNPYSDCHRSSCDSKPWLNTSSNAVALSCARR